VDNRDKAVLAHQYRQWGKKYASSLSQELTYPQKWAMCMERVSMIINKTSAPPDIKPELIDSFMLGVAEAFAEIR
jgi:hypothetical protein